MAIALNKGNGGQVLADQSKPSYEELLEMLAAERAKNVSGVVRFKQSERKPSFWTLFHGTKGSYPVTATVDAWRVILANTKMIEAALSRVK